MSRCVRGERALLETGYAPAAPVPHQRAGSCHRHAAAAAAWVFVLEAAQSERTACWYWTRTGSAAKRSRGFRSFDECVTDAREQGFDFEQPYHVTAAS